MPVHIPVQDFAEEFAEDAGVISSEPRSILLNRVDAATNAAFRQLRKGKK